MIPARTMLALSALLLATPALAWIPKLEEVSARAVIDGAYGRRDPVQTYLAADLNVEGGKFRAATVRAFDGGDACLNSWLAAPGDPAQGSRPLSLTLSGQADGLSFQAVQARDSFKNLTVPEGLAATTGRLPDGQLRLDLVVSGLKDIKQRGAYLVRLRGPDGKLVAPARSSYVDDWKPVVPAPAAGGAAATTPAATQGPLTGTLVYYFEPLKAGLNANDKVEVLIRTEADTACAYAVAFDLGSFY
jgi:hypothetical protein